MSWALAPQKTVPTPPASGCCGTNHFALLVTRCRNRHFTQITPSLSANTIFVSGKFVQKVFFCGMKKIFSCDSHACCLPFCPQLKISAFFLGRSQFPINLRAATTLMIEDEMTKILMLDDHKLVTYAIVQAWSGLFQFHVVNHIAALWAALEASTDYIVLLDINLRDGKQGPQLLAQLLQRQIKTILLTGYASEENLRAAYYMGADGFLNKDCDVHAVRRAIEAVQANQTAFSGEFLNMILNNPQQGLPYLSKMEHATLNALFANPTPSNLQIGEQIAKSISHVKNLIGELFRKFRVANRNALVLEARRRGFVPDVPLLRLPRSTPYTRQTETMLR